MKKIFLFLFVIMTTLSLHAQGEWEKPVDTQTQQDVKKRGLLDRNRDKKAIDPKYLEGAVPEKDGKVCWEKTFEVKGETAENIYTKVLEFMQAFVKKEPQTNKSNVSVVNKTKYQIGVRLQENLVFSNSLLSLDQTLFNYNLIISCVDGSFNVVLTNISYDYEKGRPTAFVMTAEEMISDAEALNKKKTGFTKGGSKKFRTKTIDRKDEIFDEIAKAFSK